MTEPKDVVERLAVLESRNTNLRPSEYGSLREAAGEITQLRAALTAARAALAESEKQLRFKQNLCESHLRDAESAEASRDELLAACQRYGIQYDAMKARAEKAEAALAAAERKSDERDKDAERYRWLKEYAMWISCADDDSEAGNFALGEEDDDMETLDAAIDSALAATKGGAR